MKLVITTISAVLTLAGCSTIPNDYGSFTRDISAEEVSINVNSPWGGSMSITAKGWNSSVNAGDRKETLEEKLEDLPTLEDLPPIPPDPPDLSTIPAKTPP